MRKYDLHIGARVYCADQECGSLAQIVITPETQEASSIVVESGLFFMKTSRVLPVELIKSATDESIHLNIQSSQMSMYPEYKEIDVEEPDLSVETSNVITTDGYSESRVPMVRRRLRQGIPSDMAIVGAGTEIETDGSVVGHVDHVIVDELTGLLTHIVMRRGMFFSDYLVIPTKMIETVDSIVFLSVSAEELESLPRYETPDAEEILTEIQKFFANEDEWYGSVRPTVEGRTLHLNGTVRSRAIKYHAEQLAESIDGVLDIENNLRIFPDTETQILDVSIDIASQVQSALTADPRTADAAIEVVDDGGIVILQGVVKEASTRQAVEEIAWQQQGVMNVFNEIVVFAR